MADDAGDKTEPPTPRRRNESRNRGQVARSQELTASVLLFAAIVGLALFGRGIWMAMLDVMHSALRGDELPDINATMVFMGHSMAHVGKAVAPLMALILIIGIAVLYAQIGWLLTLEPLTPKLDKLNPIGGIKRLFSPHSLIQLAQNILKLSVIAGVAWVSVRSVFNKIIFANALDTVLIMPLAADLIFGLGMRLVLVLFVLAVIDYIYQRYRHEKQLKMTKEEVKEEMRRMEGDPVVKRRRREVQLRLAAERVKTSVPQADVVVTNPTHYAVALKYDVPAMAAPKVIAKGVDEMALRIREIAAAAGVPIVEKPVLARMLYSEVPLGREIPEKFYRVVAEILAYVYELSRQNLGPAPVPVT